MTDEVQYSFFMNYLFYVQHNPIFPFIPTKWKKEKLINFKLIGITRIAFVYRDWTIRE